jgi:hypothetical protein
MNRRIFEVLKREGECWHSDISKRNDEFKCGCGFKTADYYTFEFHLENNPNPDFSTWEGFGWAITRCYDKGISFKIEKRFNITLDTIVLWVEFSNEATGYSYGKSFHNDLDVVKCAMEVLGKFLKGGAAHNEH